MTAKSWHCRPASHSQVDNNNNNNSKLWSSINGQLVTTRYKMQFWSTIHFWSAKAAFMFTLTAVFPLTSARLTWVGLPSKDVVLLATSLLPPNTTSSQPSLVTPTPNTSSSPEFFWVKNEYWSIWDLVQAQLSAFQVWLPRGGRWGCEIAPQLSQLEPGRRKFFS